MCRLATFTSPHVTVADEGVIVIGIAKKQKMCISGKIKSSLSEDLAYLTIKGRKKDLEDFSEKLKLN